MANCANLTSVTIPNSVTGLGDYAFAGTHFTSVTIPGTATNIGNGVFSSCPSLASVTIPGSVTNLGDYAFAGCTNLTGAYSKGSAPSQVSEFYVFSDNSTVYYLPGTSGWSNYFAGFPAVLWNPLIQTADASFGVQNNRFGFNVTGTNSFTVVAACSNLADPVWVPLTTNTLVSGSFYFSDPQWTNYPNRFYSLQMP